jgi:hypothetical protein
VVHKQNIFVSRWDPANRPISARCGLNWGISASACPHPADDGTLSEHITTIYLPCPHMGPISGRPRAFSFRKFVIRFGLNVRILFAASHVHSCREKWKYAISPFHCGKFLLFLSIPVKITYKCIVNLIALASGNTHFSTCRIDLLNSYFRFVVYVKSSRFWETARTKKRKKNNNNNNKLAQYDFFQGPHLLGAPDRDSFCLSYFTQPIFTLLFSFSTPVYAKDIGPSDLTDVQCLWSD